MKGRVTVYSITGCPFCIKAKGLLEERQLEYTDVNVDRIPTARTWLIEKTGKKTVPQIFFNAQHVGGLDDLSALNSDDFYALVKDVEESEPPDDAPPLFTQQEEEDGKDLLRCEPDEYSQIVSELREKSGIVGNHRKGVCSLKNSFVGREAVDWLMKHKHIDRPAAVDMCKLLVERHFTTAASGQTSVKFKDDSSIYKFIEDDDSNALNATVPSSCAPRPASELGEDLRQLILSIYNDHLSKDGKKVDYSAIASNPKFTQYSQLTGELRRVQLEELSREEKLAFFINIYNALVIHGFVVVGPPKSLWQRYKFFNTVCYTIGGLQFSLQDIENGVLRSNRKALGAFSKPFGKSDGRLRVMLEQVEPKIHFALVCGAKSCPPIKTYSAKDIDNQLKLATESFLEGEGVEVDMSSRTIRTSKILDWYKVDFGGNKKEVVEYIRDNIDACEKKTQIEELLQTGSNFKLAYMPYDWSLNS